MTNFIFKSQGLIKNVVNKLEIIQSELRHQRSDNQQILSKLTLILHELDIRNQADEFYQKKLDTEGIPLEDMAQDGNSSE